MKLSVLLPVYNPNLEHFRKAITSILYQSYREFELLILDDGSSVDIRKEVRTFNDQRIHYIKNRENLGLSRTLNLGIELASGEYIARMDADDISLKERFKAQVAYLDQNSEVSFLFTMVQRIDASGADKGEWRDDVRNLSSGDIRNFLFYKNCLAHPTLMARKRDIVKINGYSEYIKSAQDYNLWLKAIKHGLIIEKIPQKLLLYRESPGSVTHSKKGKFDFLRDPLVQINFILREGGFGWFNLKLFTCVLRNILKDSTKSIYKWIRQ